MRLDGTALVPTREVTCHPTARRLSTSSPGLRETRAPSPLPLVCPGHCCQLSAPPHHVLRQAISGFAAAFAAEPAATTTRFSRSSPGRAGERGLWRMYPASLFVSTFCCFSQLPIGFLVELGDSHVRDVVGLTIDRKSYSVVSMSPSEPSPRPSCSTDSTNLPKSPARNHGFPASFRNTPPRRRSLRRETRSTRWLWKRLPLTVTCFRARAPGKPLS